MSQEDEALLRAVREWRPPTKLHPMAMQAWHVYEQHAMTLPAEGVDAIRQMLDLHRDDLRSLAEAIEGLGRFMILLTEHRKDSVNGKKVADLMREYTPLFEPFWQRVGEALENVGAESQGALRRFTGTAPEKKVAVRHDAPAPKGTVPLSALVGAARPPPWARKKAEARAR